MKSCLQLVPLTLNDVDSMLKLNSCPEVVKYTGEPVISTRIAAQQAIADLLPPQGFPGIFWAFSPSHQCIGWTGFRYYPSQVPAISFRLFPAYWGKSLGQQLVNEALQIAEAHSFSFIQAQIHPHNVGSKKVVAACHFTFSSTFMWEGSPWERWVYPAEAVFFPSFNRSSK